jgi:hypothetical protein
VHDRDDGAPYDPNIALIDGRWPSTRSVTDHTLLIRSGWPTICTPPVTANRPANLYPDAEGEAGIFYVRHPDEACGRITSITLKHAPVLLGDGRSTLRQLIHADPRAGRIPHIYLPRLAHRLDNVPATGERVRLVFVGNHCKGSIFQDGTWLATTALTEAFERIARSMPNFHFGRIDVRFESLPALLSGEGFRIIEINGAAQRQRISGIRAHRYGMPGMHSSSTTEPRSRSARRIGRAGSAHQAFARCINCGDAKSS